MKRGERSKSDLSGKRELGRYAGRKKKGCSFLLPLKKEVAALTAE